MSPEFDSPDLLFMAGNAGRGSLKRSADEERRSPQKRVHWRAPKNQEGGRDVEREGE